MLQSNDPFLLTTNQLTVRRHDNTLIVADHIIAESADEQGNTITIGHDAENLIGIYRTPGGQAKAYSIPLLAIAGIFQLAHTEMLPMPHVRPITTADKEMAEEEEAEAQAELNREASPEEVAAAEAEIAPPIPDELMRFDSSQISSGQYSPSKRELRITFNSGSTYRYSDVPPNVWADMKEAPSVGSYFTRAVKGVYAYEKME